MKQLPSPEFRKTYPRLTEPVEVTALGRMIGTYIPRGCAVTNDPNVNIVVTPADVSKVKRGALSQADKDAILRRVNRAG